MLALRAPFRAWLAVSLIGCGAGQPPAPAAPPPEPVVVALEAGLDAGDAGDAAATDAATDSSFPAVDAGVSLVPPPDAEVPPEAPAPVTSSTAAPPGRSDSATLLVNLDVIRATPWSASVGAIAGALPPWQGLGLPDLTVDWVLVSGPSLLHTERAVVVLSSREDDATLDRWLDALAAKTHGGAFRVPGMPDVHAVSTQLDMATRVALRPQHHVIAIVPPDTAGSAARTLRARTPGRQGSTEALRVRLREPHRVVPDLAIEGVTELRFQITPTPDHGADVILEEDAPTPEAAGEAKDSLATTLRTRNSLMVKVVTGGLLDHVDFAARGRTAHARVHASPDQVKNLIGLFASVVGVGVPAPPP